jgi:hypothetical protein
LSPSSKPWRLLEVTCEKPVKNVIPDFSFVSAVAR